MHTQAESEHRDRRQPASVLSAATGIFLYLLTLTGEGMLGAGARWLLAYLGAAVVGAFVPLGPSAESIALAAAFAPLAWSVLGLLSPGPGDVWRRRLGARQPTGDECSAICDAIALLRGSNPALPEPPRCYILDEPLPNAAVRGRTMLLSRPLLETDSFAAVLAHELGHANSLDGRLTEALQRLELWNDPLRPLDDEPAHQREGGLLLGCARWLLRLAGGGCAEQLLSPLWAAYWRWREHAADAYAASLGQAEELACHLADYEQPFDVPQRRLLFNRSNHPPVAHRIERLAASVPTAGGSK